MGFLQNLDNLRIVAVLIIIAIVLLFAAVIGIFLIVRHFKNKDDAAKGVTEDGKNYQETKRENIEEFVPIDDIAGGCVIDEDYTRFTAIIKTTGSDFYNKSEEAQIAVQAQYEGFIRSTTEPWSFYHLSQNIDLDNVRTNIDRCISSIEESLFASTERYKQLRNMYNEAKSKDVPPDEKLVDEMLKLQTRISGFQLRLREAREELSYANSFDSPDRSVEKSVLVYTFSWNYAATPFEKKLSNRERVEKANEELDRTCAQFISLLGNAGVSARRMTTDEIVELCYAHTHPVSCGQFRLSKYFRHQVEDGGIVATKSVQNRRHEWKNNLVNQMLFGKG